MTTNRVLISLGDRELEDEMNRCVCLFAYTETIRRREKEVIYGAMMTAYHGLKALTKKTGKGGRHVFF